MAKAVNPIKAIVGGITQVKNSANAVAINNKNVKNGTTVQSSRTAPPKKLVMGPKNVAKAFIAGAKDPKAAKTQAAQLKAMKGK
ncbi:MAG: hypothetical protein GC200_12490 [Tepidisphaera sp.]|nr:hypothetical protein [Tepidisphaera sp.]